MIFTTKIAQINYVQSLLIPCYPKLCRFIGTLSIPDKKLPHKDLPPSTTTSSNSNSKSQSQNKNEKMIKVAIIGVPNAGKSTFINNLINHRICPTSNKVHTTRSYAKAICVKNNSQIILFDTPGLVSEREIKKHQLESTFKNSYKHSINNSDIIAVIHDVSNQHTRNRLHPMVLDALETNAKIPSFLVLNKIDTLKSKRVLLDLARLLTNGMMAGKPMIDYTKRRENKKLIDKDKDIDEKQPKKIERVGWPMFSSIFMISSLTGDGLEGVMKYILSQSKVKSWEYSASEFTDQPPESLIEQCVRARLLDYLPQEIPYLLKCEIEFYTVEKGQIFTSVLVTCPSERIERLVCGAENGKLKQITERATSDLVETFSKPVSLTVCTKTKLPNKP